MEDPQPSNQTPPPPADPAPASPPGEPPRKKMTWIWILALCGLLTPCCCCSGVWYLFFRNRHSAETDSKYARAAAAPAITSGDLMQSYLENPTRADTLYRNKLLRVAGLVANTLQDNMGNVFVGLATSDVNRPVICICYATDKQAQALQQGDYVIIAGTCDGFTGNVRIKDAFVFQSPHGAATAK